MPSDRPTGSSGSSHPRGMMETQMNNPRTPVDGGGQLCHPRTPLEGQIGHAHTPIEGQLSHPRTPVDGQLCPSRASMDSQSGQACQSSDGHVLRHAAPGTPGSLGNPLTPASCGSGRTCRNGSTEFGGSSNGGNGSSGSTGGGNGNGGGASSGVSNPPRCSSSNSLYSNTLANNNFTSSGQQQQQMQQQQMQQQQMQQQQQQPPLSSSSNSSSSIDNGFSTELGFHTSTLIDSDSIQGQESLDVSSLEVAIQLYFMKNCCGVFINHSIFMYAHLVLNKYNVFMVGLTTRINDGLLVHNISEMLHAYCISTKSFFAALQIFVTA